ncbi:MAG: hypothetical protein HY843_01325 [Bdellovibrio sp.]|nr:hypothetical protein [Bdellovibrio sp.]
MKIVNKQALLEFLKLASNKLNGDWIVLGGSVLPLMGIESRVTTDIDVVKINNSTQAETLELMELTEKLGFPIETINQASAYFLFKIADFKKHLVLLQRGTNASFYRPDLYLFLQLKLPRLSESDFHDCVEMIKISKEESKLEGIMKIIQAAIKNERSSAKRARLKRLKAHLP